jgi:DNA-directed RNA polymerase subunit N (RpoN/RPB10)
MKSKFNPSVRDGKPVKCIACGNPLQHKSEHYCSKKCATKMESESIADAPAFLSKWKLRKYKVFKDPLSVLRKKTRRKTNDLLKKGIIQINRILFL